jgi:ABC-type phosphate/phosphonate transport system permease subunit
MALPPTGSTITMSEIRNYFGNASTPITMSFLGTFLGISVGTTIAMSATFGGQGTPEI